MLSAQGITIFWPVGMVPYPRIYNVLAGRHAQCPRNYNILAGRHAQCPRIDSVLSGRHAQCPKIYSVLAGLHAQCPRIFAKVVYDKSRSQSDPLESDSSPRASKSTATESRTSTSPASDGSAAADNACAYNSCRTQPRYTFQMASRCAASGSISRKRVPDPYNVRDVGGNPALGTRTLATYCCDGLSNSITMAPFDISRNLDSPNVAKTWWFKMRVL